MELTNNGSTLMYAINDTAGGNNVPSLPLGQTADGDTITAKAVFADELSANLMVKNLEGQPGSHPGRFEVQVVEVWRATDIELYVRERIREHEKGKGPKLIIPGGM